jgi:hypothetical protein
MRKSEFKLEVEKIHDICMGVLFKKGVEYQNNNVGQDEVLANFYRGSELVDIIPEKILLIYMSKHWDSVSKFIKTIDKDGFEAAINLSSEPIHMRIVDIINYLYLLNAMLIEREKKNQDPNFPKVFDRSPSPLSNPKNYDEIKTGLASVSGANLDYAFAQVADAEHMIARELKCEVSAPIYMEMKEMTDEMKAIIDGVSKPTWEPAEEVKIDSMGQNDKENLSGD